MRGGDLLPRLCSRHVLDLLVKERGIPFTILGTATLPSRVSQRVATALEDALLTISGWTCWSDESGWRTSNSIGSASKL